MDWRSAGEFRSVNGLNEGGHRLGALVLGENMDRPGEPGAAVRDGALVALAEL